MLKYCEKQRDVFDNELLVADVDSVQHVKRMLDEEEDARTKDFLGCRGKHKG